MKKSLLFAALAAVVLAGCNRKEDSGTDQPGGFPTDNLVVDSTQAVLLSETTGAWCQYCPNGAKALKEAEAAFGNDIIAVALHNNDDLSNATSADWEVNYPTTGVPNFYVGNVDAGQDITNQILMQRDQRPVMGVAHSVVESPTAYTVYAKVKVFENSSTSNYLIQSYLLLDAVQAKGYPGGIDLTQVSSVPIVNQGNLNTGSYWTQNIDTYIGNGVSIDTVRLVNANDRYFHEHVLYDRSNTAFSWGASLDSINPFGMEYYRGDVLGSKYTPIQLEIPKKSLAPYETGVHILTVIWKVRQDGNLGYDYVNGFVSKVGGTN
jgi:hypothetical protein